MLRWLRVSWNGFLVVMAFQIIQVLLFAFIAHSWITYLLDVASIIGILVIYGGKNA